jgi:hypothetical protein
MNFLSPPPFGPFHTHIHTFGISEFGAVQKISFLGDLTMKKKYIAKKKG